MIYRLKNLIGEAEDLITEETRRVCEASSRDTEIEIERAIDLAVNGPAEEGVSTTGMAP